MHQGAEPIARTFQCHHKAKQDDEPAGIKVALAHKTMDKLRDRTTFGPQRILHPFLSF
jgi:hypothetical protein